MSVYNVYKHDVLIEEEITAKEVSEITGIPGNSVCRYAEQGTIKNGTYRVELSDITIDQLERWDKACRMFKINIERSKQKIRSLQHESK